MHPQQMVTAHSPFGSTQQGGRGKKNILFACDYIVTFSVLSREGMKTALHDKYRQLLPGYTDGDV